MYFSRFNILILRLLRYILYINLDSEKNMTIIKAMKIKIKVKINLTIKYNKLSSLAWIILIWCSIKLFRHIFAASSKVKTNLMFFIQKVKRNLIKKLISSKYWKKLEILILYFQKLRRIKIWKINYIKMIKTL